jgi:Family of unknown function (DUF5678)
VNAQVKDISAEEGLASAARTMQSVIVSSSDPAEILKQLESYGIEWAITEEGSLWIKYWRIGAENFVPREHAAKLREGGKMHSEVDAIEWVSKNLATLRTNYAGKWIAVKDAQVVADANTLAALMKQLSDKDIDRPFITEIPKSRVVWASTYVHKNV